MINYIVLGLVCIGFVMGYMKGLLRQVSSIIGLIIGYIIAKLFSDDLRNFLISENIIESNVSSWFTFILTIIISVVFFSILTRLIEKFLTSIGLNFTNKIAGGLLGFAKYAIVISIILFFALKLKITKSEALHPTMLYVVNIIGHFIFNE